MSRARRWIFGPAVLDEATLELVVNGAVVNVEKKPLEVLQHLLLRAGQVVSKDELAKACWPGRILSDSVLSKTFSRLREALQDQDQVLIKTVHGYGYRLVVPVRLEMPAAPDPAPAVERAKPAPARRPVEAERRQITVLFCDLVDSTRLSQQLDPEAFRELLLAYQATVAEVIERYGGHIAQYLGDGLLVYFGHPAAHEDDAERAVRAGYDIHGALKKVAPGNLSARVGIHTGEVVVGEMGSTVQPATLAVGETTNLAARLQSVAEPGTVVVSDVTLKLVPGLFVTRDRGPQQLKGINRPVQVHQVVQPSGVRTRLEAAAKLTPFVGRESEVSLLDDRWQQACEGRGQAVLISGEPGLGKSRLLLTLRERLKESTHSWLECRCSAMTQDSAFAPIIELLHRGLQIRDEDSEAHRLERLERALDLIGQDKLEAVPLLAPLLNLTPPKQYPPSPYSPELKRKKVLDLLAGWIVALSRHQPLVVVVEDLHWADPSSQDLLCVLIEQIAVQRVLLLLSARPEFEPAWPQRNHAGHLSLQPLRKRESGALLDLLTGQPLPDELKERLLAQSGGVPLHLEEVTRHVLESGLVVERDGRLELAGSGSAQIPATLRDSLMARLDRHGQAKATAQLCSVIGREIPYPLLAQVSGIDEPTLQQHLQILIGAQLLYVRGAVPDATFLFKHALIQDAAYESLLKSTRQKWHGQIAETLAAPERSGGEPAVFALHFERAGQFQRAIHGYKLAAEQAQARQALRETIAYSDSALRLLPLLPANAERDALELQLLAGAIKARLVVSGFAHPDVKRLARRSSDLLNDSHDPLLQVATLTNLFYAHHFTGEFEAAVACTQRVVALGQRLKASSLEAIGHVTTAQPLLALGRFAEVREVPAKVGRLCDLAASRQIAQRMDIDPVTNALLTTSWATFAMGFPEEARRQCAAAMERAEAVGVPANSCNVFSYATMNRHLFRWQPEVLLAESQSALELCRRYGHAQGEAIAKRSLGIARCQLGQFAEGIELMEQAVHDIEATGSSVTASFHYLFLAEQYLAGGRLGPARATVDRILRDATPHGLLHAEMHRLNGELLQAEGAPAEYAEAAFRKALEIARRQQAKSYELRAATNLARMWQRLGRAADAREVLHPVYGWFTEGHDTPDLKDAKAVLDAFG